MIERLRQEALRLGAFRAEIVRVADISLDASFREMCASNVCGNYGKNHMCPPDIGDIHVLMERLKSYNRALIYQTVWNLEDSYDFEGMMEAGKGHNALTGKLWDLTDEMIAGKILHLGAGGCRICESCAKRTGEPCRHPQRAIGSLEAYGVNVSLLAQLAGMRYINGPDTVTYFGGIFFQEA